MPLFNLKKEEKRVPNKERLYSWYAILTGDGETILEALCISYYSTPLGHAKIAELDQRWKRPLGFVRSILVPAHPDDVGDTISMRTSRKLAFYQNEAERVQHFFLRQKMAFQERPSLHSTLLVDLGTDRKWPLPWLILWMGSRGFELKHSVALTTLHDWRVEHWMLESFIDYGLKLKLPSPELNRDEEQVLLSILEDV